MMMFFFHTLKESTSFKDNLTKMLSKAESDFCNNYQTKIPSLHLESESHKKALLP